MCVLIICIGLLSWTTGVSLYKVTVSISVDPKAGQCLSMEHDAIRVVPCHGQSAYICYAGGTGNGCSNSQPDPDEQEGGSSDGTRLPWPMDTRRPEATTSRYVLTQSVTSNTEAATARYPCIPSVPSSPGGLTKPIACNPNLPRDVHKFFEDLNSRLDSSAMSPAKICDSSNRNQTTELKEVIDRGEFDKATEMIKNMKRTDISDILRSVLASKTTADFKFTSFAYYMWHNGAQDIVRDYFPEAFKFIFSGENVLIVNYGYQQALTLGTILENDRWTWGRTGFQNKPIFRWQLIPVWQNNEVTFKMYNVHYNMYVKLDCNPIGNGDRRAWGDIHSNVDRFRYYLEPYLLMDGTVAFIINNLYYHESLKLGSTKKAHGDRELWGHNGEIYQIGDAFKWHIIRA